MIGETCWSRCLATGFALPLRRGLPGHDAVNPVTTILFGHQRQAELFAYHPGKEAADRVGLPAGCLHDRRDGCTLLAAEHLDHPGLLRSPPAGLGRLLRSLGPGLLATSSSSHPPRRPGIGPGLRLRAALVDLESRKTSRRHHRSPAVARKPAGQNPVTRPCRLVGRSHITALLAPKCQFFLDNLIAGFSARESSISRSTPPVAPSPTSPAGRPPSDSGGAR